MNNISGGFAAGLVPHGEVIRVDGADNGNSENRAKVAGVIAKAMQFWAPMAKARLAECFGINRVERPPVAPTLQVHLEAIGSGGVLKPLLEISLDDGRTMHEILTEELRKGDPLGDDTTFIFLQDQKICVLEKRPQDYHSEGEINLQVARKYVPGKAAALAAVSKNGLVLLCASAELKADRDVVLAAVSQIGVALYYAAEELRADRDVVLAAVSQNGMALRYAAAELKADRDVVLAAVSKHGDALECAAEALRADRDVVLAAVSQNGMALRYAADKLQADRQVVLTAVSNHEWALNYAAAELKGDRDVVLAAVGQNGEALQFAADELQADPEIRAAAGLV